MLRIFIALFLYRDNIYVYVYLDNIVNWFRIQDNMKTIQGYAIFFFISPQNVVDFYFQWNDKISRNFYDFNSISSAIYLANFAIKAFCEILTNKPSTAVQYNLETSLKLNTSKFIHKVYKWNGLKYTFGSEYNRWRRVWKDYFDSVWYLRTF